MTMETRRPVGYVDAGAEAVLIISAKSSRIPRFIAEKRPSYLGESYLFSDVNQCRRSLIFSPSALVDSFGALVTSSVNMTETSAVNSHIRVPFSSRGALNDAASIQFYVSTVSSVSVGISVRSTPYGVPAIA